MTLWQKFTALLVSFWLTLTGAIGGLTRMNVKTEITLQPDRQMQTVDGFGTSACWWSPQLGDDALREEIIQKLYGTDGLALNIYRYNVGGGVNPAHERVRDPWRRTESFLVEDGHGGWTYDFTRDANAQAALFAALRRGTVDTVVLFANSPHYSMTVSGESSGGFTKAASNLKKDCYQDYVDYFLTVTEYFLSKGVPVKLISPINEPQWDWGGDWVGQEGCHFETAEIVALLHLFAVGIENRKLPVKLSVPESGSIDGLTPEYFDALAQDEVILRNIGSFSYHSYWKDDAKREKQDFGDWYRAKPYAGLPLEMSEWCELPNKHATTDPTAAVIMARVIADDLGLTNANSWTSWVAVNQEGIDRMTGLDYSDGLFTADPAFTRCSATYRYDALGHYSKFIPAGSRVIGAEVSQVKRTLTGTEDQDTDLTVCAAQRPDGAAVLVIVNPGDSRFVRLNADGTKMTVHTTDASRHLAQTYAGPATHTLLLPAVSVTTVVLR